ncbi:MAG: glycosyltransferase family A protein [Elusimicrobiaceae bacterium]|jgi:glycosyltransferase involved in cell wall biosynthesis
MIRISVIIPLYNKAAHIKRALDSVLNQTEQDFEIIVIDDGSTDAGEDIVKTYADPRIKYFRQENQGVSVARNNGIKQAQADFVSFLDADDEYLPKFLETVLRLRKNYPQAGLYSTAYQIQEPNGKTKKPQYKAIPPFPWEGIIPDYFESALGTQPCWTSAVAVPKQVFEKAGYFPPGEKLGEDLDTWFRIALKYPVIFSNYRGAVYHQNTQNRSCSLYKNTQGYVLVQTAKNALDSNNIPIKSVPFVQGIIDRKLISAATWCVLAGEGKAARAHLWQTNSRYYIPLKLKWIIFSLLPISMIKWHRR